MAADRDLMTVSAIAVIDLINEMLDRSILKEDGIQSIGDDVLSEYLQFKGKESIVEHRLPEAHLISLWNRIKPDSSFAFEIGSTVNSEAKGLLANWISYSDTLADAFTTFTNNVMLLNHAENWTLIENNKPDEVRLEFKYESELSYPNLAIERSMVAMIAWANHLVSEPLNIKSVSLTYPKPSHHLMYENLFSGVIEFDAAVNQVTLSQTEFYQQLDSANPYLRGILKERSEQLKLSMTAVESIKAKVQVLLKQDLSHYCNLENTLGELHLSRASLYRKLKEQENTFSELVRTERFEKLKDLKKSNISSEECAQVLGFSDVSSYYRFLKSQ